MGVSAAPSVAGMLASVATFALVGRRQPGGHGRGRRSPRPARVHARRPARRRRARGARAGAGGAAELRPRLSAAAPHRQPRARVDPQGGAELRPGARRRRARRQRPGARRRARRRTPCAASCRSVARCARSAGALAAASAPRARGIERLIVPARERARGGARRMGWRCSRCPTWRGWSISCTGAGSPRARRRPAPLPRRRRGAPDLADVRGQARRQARARDRGRGRAQPADGRARRAPGKTMLARRLPGILPPPSFDEALEITRIHSVAGLGDGRLAAERPFRAPHHTISPSGPGRAAGRAPAGRDHAGPPRRPVPRRAGRVLPRRARGAAPAARGRVRRDHARPALAHLPGPDDARRRVQPVPVRAPGGRLPLQRAWTGCATAAGSAVRCWTGSTSSVKRLPPPAAELVDRHGASDSSAPRPSASG